MAEEHRRLVWQISRNSLVRKILSDRFFDGIGLQRGRFPMLQVLLHNEGCTQIEVAEQLRISPASVAVTLRRMERDGLVQRREDTQDQRCKRIYATEKAKEIAERSRRWMKKCSRVFPRRSWKRSAVCSIDYSTTLRATNSGT